MPISDELMLRLQSGSELFVPHIGWLRYPSNDIVLLHLREGSFEFCEQAFLWSFLREDDIFLDIGAHCGLFSALASQLIGDAGRILAFEPNPDILPFLMANTRRDKVDIHAVALSDASGEAILWQGGASDTAFSSIAYELPNSKHSIVKTQTLDDLLAILGIGQVALAKVDVEGSELRLFRGAKKTLQKKTVLAFVVEFTEENMRKSGYSALELATQLIEYGYRPYKMAAEATDLVPFEVQESIEYENIVFTHDPVAVLDRIRQTPVENARRSKEIIGRGSAAEALVRSLWSVEKEAAKRLALVNDLTAECRSRDQTIAELRVEFTREVLKRLKAIEDRLDDLDKRQERLHEAYARSRAHLRRFWLRPPMWTFEQHSPRSLDLRALPGPPALPDQVPGIAIVTPTLNQGRFLRATIDSVIGQNYPRLSYQVQDGGSDDNTVEILKSYGDKISWRSAPDNGQSAAINAGFAEADCDIMAYLNSDDTLLPGALAFVANFFQSRPDIDILYGHRVFIDNEGLEIGRAILPAHDNKAIHYAGYIPQETMFWRRRVWDAIGEMDVNFHYALDWDFILRAQAAGFKFARVRRFLACFRVHDEQKTTRNYEVGRQEMRTLRVKYLGHAPSQPEIYRAMLPYLVRQFLFHWSYRLGLLKQ